MKRILMAMVVAVGIAVAIPFAPVQVQEAEARPECFAASVNKNGDEFVDDQDMVAAASQPGNSGLVHLGFITSEECWGTTVR